jgi:hypothetical protein
LVDNNLVTQSCSHNHENSSTVSSLVAETIDLIANPYRARPIINIFPSFAQNPGLSSQDACSSTFAEAPRLTQPALPILPSTSSSPTGGLPPIATLAREVARTTLARIPLGARNNPIVSAWQSSRPFTSPFSPGSVAPSRVPLGTRSSPTPPRSTFSFASLLTNSSHIPLGPRPTPSLLHTRSFAAMSSPTPVLARVALGSRK